MTWLPLQSACTQYRVTIGSSVELEQRMARQEAVDMGWEDADIPPAEYTDEWEEF